MKMETEQAAKQTALSEYVKKKKKNNQFLKNHRKIQRSCVQKMATGTEAHVTAHFHLPRPGE